MRTLSHRPQSQHGISLIEALVALLVLALGILGLVGLQTRTITDARLTNSRAVAVRMVTDLQERMMLNTLARALPINPYLSGWGPAGAAPDCNAVACNGAQLAAFDLRQWKVTLANSLPAGDGSIYQSPNDPTQFGVLIGWTDNIGARADADQATYVAPLVVTTNVPAAVCPPGLTCHLVHLRP